ncbi:MAG TPA: SDR family oxidoreductase [Pseudonocardiaceae bacterium]|jgi:NAD(P)H dehydrogenase (quinone)|nr:SDR family oxidoreductase [Pseudonocardiaceae bacterium]
MIVVTAATGLLGQLVVDGLLRGVPAEEIAVAVRNPDKAAGLAARGVTVRAADYDDPASLRAALSGADKVLFISGAGVPEREDQHLRVVDAVKQVGVGQLAYTSVLHADTSTLLVTPDHQVTERAIRDAGVPFTFLRNGWYTENFAARIQGALHTGILAGNATPTATLASAARLDYAEAAVAALTGDGHLNKVYELAGDVEWSFTDLAAELTRQSGKQIDYRQLSAAEHEKLLVEQGIPAGFAGLLTHTDQGIVEGELSDDSGDLRGLIGHPTTSLADVVAAIIKS